MEPKTTHRNAPHSELWRRYRHYAALQDYRLSVLFSILTFLASVVVSFFAIRFATERASNSVTDLILSNVPAVDLDGTFVFGTLFLIIFVFLVLFAHPKRIPFALHALALFYLIRAAFLTMTHIGPFPDIVPADDWGALVGTFLFNSDLFFSGHTGAPFMLALVFWREKHFRYIFLAWSVFMATIVLLGHYHYTIDVASAFFITYTIYKIAEWLFPKDRALYYSDVPADFK